jgi:hypothetical protein
LSQAAIAFLKIVKFFGVVLDEIFELEEEDL